MAFEDLGNFGPLGGQEPPQPSLPEPGGMGISPAPEEYLAASPSASLSDKPYFKAVYDKVSSGIFGLPIPQIFASAALGAVTGAGVAGAPTLGVGAPVGAAIGALVGGLADFLGASADVGVQRALEPSGGLQTPLGHVSPELAGMLTGLVVGGAGLGKGITTAVKAAEKLAVKVSPEVATYVLKNTGKTAQQVMDFMPTDPFKFAYETDPKLKVMQRAINKSGIPWDWDYHFDRMPAEEYNKLVNFFTEKILTPSAGTDYTKSLLGVPIGKSEIVRGYRRGMDMTADVGWKNVFRFLAPPHRMVVGDQAAEMYLHTLTSGEMWMNALRHQHTKQTEEFFAGITDVDKQFLRDTILAHEGRITKGRGAPSSQTTLAPLLDEAPVTTTQLMMPEMKERVSDFLTRSGKEHLVDPWNNIWGRHEEQRKTLVELGILKEDQVYWNYLSHVRMRYASETPQMIELPHGYFPVSIEKTMGKAKPYFMNERHIQIPPEDLTLDHILNTYNNAYSHAVVNAGSFGKLQGLMPMIKSENVKAYLGATYNYFVGNPTGALDHISREWANTIKSVEFLRTIGGSLLTPLINASQSLNMLAFVSPKNWFKALGSNTAMNSRLEQLGVTGKDILTGTPALDTGDMLYDTMKGGMKSLQKWFGTPFAMSENFVRQHAYKAGMYEAIERGIPEPMAEKFALWAMDKTNFVTKIGRTPSIMRDPLFSTIGQFRTYTLNQLAFVDSMTRINPTGAAKYALGALMLLGPDAIAPGADITLTRHLLGKPQKSPFKGAMGHLGAALAEYATITGMNPDDIKRFSQYLPGPSVDHMQNIVKALTGVDFGQGMDFSNFGMPLTSDQQASAITRSLPVMGSQLNRARVAIKLARNGYKDQASQELGQAFGISPTTGPMHRQMDTGDAVKRLFGITSTRVHDQEAMSDEMQNIAEQYKILLSRTSEMLATGRQDQADKLIARFRRKYPEVANFFPSVKGMQGATERLAFPQTWREIQHVPLPVRLPYYQQIMRREIIK